MLLDEDNQLLGETYGYRDSRTQGMDELVYQHVPEAELYAITGIQKQLFNTIYQLMAVKQQHQEYLKQAKTFLMLPDYFHFLLTGKKVQEYTNATSTPACKCEDEGVGPGAFGTAWISGKAF